MRVLIRRRSQTQTESLPMPDTFDVSRYDLPAGALLNAVALDSAPGGRAQLLAQLRDSIEKSREEQEEWKSRFDSLYDQAVRRNFSSPFLIQWAAALFERGRAAAERLYPVIEALQHKSTADTLDTEVLELFREVIDLAVDWLTPYSRLSGKLLDLASKRRVGVGEVLRARPIEGDIDHDALSREFMARFPKIRAALAK
jgi:hypothetical protein